MMPYQHVAQQLTAVGELCTNPLAHSPIDPALLDTARAIALQVSRIEEVLHQGTSHGGAETKQALEALQTNVDGLNGRVQTLRCLANMFFHDLSEVLTRLPLHIGLVEEELGRPMPAPSTQMQASLSAIKVATICLQAVVTGTKRRQGRRQAAADQGPNGPAHAAIAPQQDRGQRQRINRSRKTEGDERGNKDDET